MDEISQQLTFLLHKTQLTEKMVKSSSDDLEKFRIQLQESQKLASFIKISTQGGNQPPSNIDKVRRDLDNMEKVLQCRANELIMNRRNLIAEQKDIYNQMSAIQNTVLYKHLTQWNYDQQHSKADVNKLNQIQVWVEMLTDIIWRLRNQLKGLYHTFTTQPNVTLSPIDMDELDEFGNCVDKALETLTLNTFVVEKQPPQVMKTNTRFTSIVRFLSGVKLGVQMIKPTVKVTIMSETNARAIIQRHQELIQSCWSYQQNCSSTNTSQQQPAQISHESNVQMDISESPMNQTATTHDIYAHQHILHQAIPSQPASTRVTSHFPGIDPILQQQQLPPHQDHIQVASPHQQQPQTFVEQQQATQNYHLQQQQQQYSHHQYQHHHLSQQQQQYQPGIKVGPDSNAYHPIKIVNMNEFEPSGEIINNSNRLEYQDKQLICHFRLMQLKKIKRTEKKGTESVMDEKFVLLFHTQIRIADSYLDEMTGPSQSSWIRQGDLSYHIMAFSLPVVVIVHGNQEPHAWATITWHNAFARSDQLLYQVPNEVSWRELGQVLSDKFDSCFGRGLSSHNLQYLASKVTRSPYENDDVMVSWNQFSKEPLPNKTFTFWEWFHSILKLTREHLKDLWNDDRIYGFLGKQGCVDLLLGSSFHEPAPIGTFLLRYSETELGGITIAWVSPPSQQSQSSPNEGELHIKRSPSSLSSTSNVLNHLQPFNSRDLYTRSIADRIRDLGDLVYLYPGIPKNEAFKKYYSPLNDSHPTDNGYIKHGLIQTLVTNYRENSSSNSMEFSNPSVTPTSFSHDNSPEDDYYHQF